MTLNPKSFARVAALLSSIVFGASACTSAPGSNDQTGKDQNVAQDMAIKPAPAAVQSAWAAKLASNDPAERSAAADSAIAVQAPDSAAKLEQVISGDRDPYVRERAIFAYAQLQKKSAVAFLKRVAISN